ncbi:peptide ABC transporter permease [Paenibacillus sp. J31TS4]|uniref:ABC transporter permease n=1 Tax=Paenibacillus sp. J31TS4 TaxID=2807195 RepID=UPI001B196978|nr:ABC transporter permease [Paenibacillus sp. J31TS4]GIP38694.1 peptide ABC transporter permease [Paenibacillus sp. J31TS4]
MNVTMEVQKSESPTTLAEPKPLSQTVRIGRSLMRSKTGMIGFAILLCVVLMAVFAPYLAPHNPSQIAASKRLIPPVWMEKGTMEHPLGTDNLGRDVLSRIIYGSQISLLVGIFAVAVAGLIGVVLGLVSGYYGGWIDKLISRVVDAFLAIPNILFILVILAVLGPGLFTLILVIGATNWVKYARILRSEVLRVKELDYVRAARSVGAKDWRIIVRHVLPNVISPFIVVSTLSVATTIILEASLSFLGMGIQSPTVTWGGMLSDGRQYLATSWWVATFPGIAITITVLGIIFLGDWLRDILDPRMKTK